MKTLYLIRHAKSSWEHDVIDHERPLKNRGFKDANLVSNYLKGTLNLPDLILSSDAMRAKTTAYIFAKNFGIDENEVILDHKLYDFSGRDLTNTISNCNNSVETLMVFGHNHAITAFVNTYGDVYTDNVATSGFTHIEFDIEFWKDLKPGKTKQSLCPKELKD